MILNFVGPMCGGKTTIGKKFVELFGDWTLVTIDQWRNKTNYEWQAWQNFATEIKRWPLTIAESSGTSKELRGALEQADRTIHTVSFNAELATLRQRITVRGLSVRLPYNLKPLGTQKWLHKHIDTASKYDIDCEVWTDDLSPEVICRTLKDNIHALQRRPPLLIS